MRELGRYGEREREGGGEQGVDGRENVNVCVCV